MEDTNITRLRCTTLVLSGIYITAVKILYTHLVYLAQTVRPGRASSTNNPEDTVVTNFLSRQNPMVRRGSCF